MTSAAAAADGSNETFNVTVQKCERNGENYVWTLSLKGFQKGQFLYIYRGTGRWKTRVTAGHEIGDPATQLVISAEASSFNPSNQDYFFR